MTPNTQDVLDSAQALPTAARVELIEALIAGLDEADPEPLDDAWIAEIQRRSAHFDAGQVQPIPWSEYRDDRQEQLQRLVEAILQGRKLEAPVEEEVPVLQLLDALKQSVAQALGQQAGTADKAPAKQPGRKKASRRSA